MTSEPHHRAQLLSIIAHARAGALDRAWAMFGALDPADVAGNPAALAVKGRLLKDKALRATGPARLALYRDAAEAYRQAAEVGGGTYPLINAATLCLLCGAEHDAHELAAEALDRVAAHPDEPETPYYRAATNAEALLLLGREDDARAALAEGVAIAPQAWEDHASTLRQFAIILGAQGRNAAWLDAFRPPRSLHFGGHMAFHADPAPTELSREIAVVIEKERIGFGYGALAAGADIIVAEALIDRGAVLHIVLPGTVDGFAAVSVDPHGPAWRRRFDAALAAAETVRTVEPGERRPDETMIALADEVAMGAALINARSLASEAVQLLIMPDDASGADGASARSRDAWARMGGRQTVLRAPRERVDLPSDDAKIIARYRAAVLAVRVAREDRQAGLDMLKTALEQCPGPDLAPIFNGEDVVLAYNDVAQAALAATILADEARNVGGQYGIAERVRDPFTGSARLTGRALELARAAADSAPPGTACITEDFAAALAVTAPDTFRSEFVGELSSVTGEAPIGLFALKPHR
jgi:tetratricopeptide (TPR) repeat protein